MATQREIFGTFIRRKTQVGGPLNYAIIRDRVAAICANAVDVKVYDTDLDSDGGAWRTGAEALASAWYNETLNTATRGATQEFPAVAVIIAEIDTITIYDGDHPDLPMWLVWTRADTAGTWIGWWRTNAIAGKVSAVNGLITFCLTTGGFVGGLCFADMLADKVGRYGQDSATGGFGLNAASGSKTDNLPNRFATGLVSSSTKGVDITVLSGAPIDPATGIETPTIAVATDGGLNVIQNDGTIDTGVEFDIYEAITFSNDGLSLYAVNSTDYRVEKYTTITLVQNYDYFGALTSARTFNLGPIIYTPEYLAWPHPNFGFVLVAENVVNPSNGMVAYIDAERNTGWMHGDIKAALLSSTALTSLVGSVLDDNFTSYADQAAAVSAGYTFTGATFDAINDQIDFNAASENFTFDGVVSLIQGDAYEIEVVTSGRTTGSVVLQENFVNVGPAISADGTTTFYLVRGTGVLRFTTATFDGSFDSIKIRRADHDRSINNNGIGVHGTIARATVATGAELVAYSGFSAANYLEQPYNSDLDFGTGDFCVMGWLYPTGSGIVFGRREPAGVGNQLGIFMNSPTDLHFYTGLSKTSEAPTVANKWNFVCAGIKDGVGFVYVDGVDVTSTINAPESVTNTSAISRFGLSASGTAPLSGSIALWRIGGTAPSTDDIATIYNYEKGLFEEGAACTLAGSSDVVKALSHDQDIDSLHVCTNDIRSVFKGLQRLYTEDDAFTVAVDVSGGVVLGK